VNIKERKKVVYNNSFLLTLGSNIDGTCKTGSLQYYNESKLAVQP